MPKEYRTSFKACLMEYLKAHKEQGICASEIYEAMRTQQIAVNLTTVYRNLEKLTASGALIKYKTAGEDSCVYQYVEPDADCCHHLHMQCSRCGKIIHLECPFMEEIRAHLLKQHGFALECKTSVLTGLCEDCRKAQSHG